ncbi:MAG: ribonuclease HII [Bacteroidetes bacterium]|nr:ribonuclease HII [Bacteroidota bacterium]
MLVLPGSQGFTPEAGCDEAGRGCLAGPVCAAAVILPDGWTHPMLNDSKQLSRKKRELLREIIEREALHWAVAMVAPEEIDRINILQASITAMHRALDQLAVSPALILVDGNKFRTYKDIPHRTEIKGDGRFVSIAAASILAKTHRDEFMETLHSLFPEYHWNQNAGYPTKSHRAAIHEFGITEHHRKSFRLLPGQLAIW